MAVTKINQGTASATEIAAATSERLYQVQSRAARGLYYSDNSSYFSDRGSIASIKLISTGNFMGGDSLDTRRVKGDLGTADVNRLLGGNAKDVYDRFLLTGFEVSYSEKTQIMTTFGDNEVVYFFGKNPVVINLQGMLVDALDNSWFTTFVNMYNTFLRGTKLAQNFEMLELVLPNMKVVGSVLSLSHQQNAARDTDIPFSMQFYAKSITMLPAINTGNTAMQNPSANAIFSNPTKKGATTASLSSNQSVGGFSEPSWLKSPDSVATGADTFRNNITSPVVSVIASMAKIIQNVTNSLTNLVSSFTTPVNTVLRDVMSIANQATAVASLIQNSAANLGHLLSTPGVNLRNTLSALRNTVGVISRLPEDVSTAFKRNYHTGGINRGAAILSSGNKGTTSKTAVLSSGKPYTAQNSFVI